ncbi:hypothetical protein SDC9_199272 [bioreactor metagenome]|uniref:Uncharacterized protein n=1 Tax=bioreactor metagenome TaxID=1076179 RepID=A0A645ITA5_9ZZZZ
MSPQCPKCLPRHGVPCVVGSALNSSADWLLKPGVKEYVANLSLLKKLINGVWDDDMLIVPPHSRIVADPVEILSAEPV